MSLIRPLFHTSLRSGLGSIYGRTSGSAWVLVPSIAAGGYYSGIGGSIDPATAEGLTIFYLYASTTKVQLKFVANARVGTTTTATVIIGGAPETSYTLTWVTSDYQLGNSLLASALQTYLNSQNGLSLSLDLQFS